MPKITFSEPTKSTPNTIISSILTIATKSAGFIDVTDEIGSLTTASNVEHGYLNLFVRHTSASLTIQENADPDVLTDLGTALGWLAPTNGGWIHSAEGPDDMPAHIKTMLTSTSLQIPIIGGAMALGSWQGIYLIEHRSRPHRREIVVQVVGETSK